MSNVFPDRCPACLRLQLHKQPCEDCKSFIRKINGKTCKKCGFEKEYCECKKQGKAREYDGVIAACYYEGTLRNTIHNLKFYLCYTAALYLKKHMALRFVEVSDPTYYDIITPIPDYSASKRLKGRSHTEYLAKSLSKILKIKYKKVLRKVVENSKQHRLAERFRSGNVSGVYDVVSNVKGKRILLLDDVLTTGNTANECAKMLKARGAAQVTVFTAAVTLPDKFTKFDILEQEKVTEI